MKDAMKALGRNKSQEVDVIPTELFLAAEMGYVKILTRIFEQI